MLAYVTLGSNDTPKALKFYDAVLGELGAKQVFNNNRLYFYSAGANQPMLAIGGTFDENAATVGNGVMPALACKDRETVYKVYNKALEMGGQDEGAPGERMPTFYGAYFRDPDGNKICVCKMG